MSGAATGGEVWAAPAARELLAESASPLPRVATIVGCGGSGKSTLMRQLHTVLVTAGKTVHLGVTGWPDMPDPDAAWLIDDAHELDAPTLDRVLDLMNQETTTVIVAYRPSVQSKAFLRLSRRRDDHHRVGLGAYARDDLAELGSMSGVSAGLLEQILDESGGMPWLVHPLLAAVTDGAPGVVDDPDPEILDLIDRRIEEGDDDLSEALLALAVGFDLSTVVPTALDTDDVSALLQRGSALGVLRADGELVPLVKKAILTRTPGHRLRGMQRELLAHAETHSARRTEIARSLARSGTKDARVSAALEHAADQSLATSPLLALELYMAAISAGGDPLSMAARKAQAAAATGDLDFAARLLDEVLATPDPPDLALAVDTLAAVWAQRGMLARGAQLYDWMADQGVDLRGGSASLAAITRIGIGNLPAVEEAPSGRPAAGSSSLFAVAMDLLGQGLRDTVQGTGERALPALIRSSDAMTSSQVARLLPDSPAALAAIVALHSGRLDVAALTIEDALLGGQCGPAARRRLVLLKGWVAMLEDRTDDAAAAVLEIGAHRPLPGRDEFLHRALEVGLARRLDDGAGLARAWLRAREYILHVPVDLYSLLPLGELVVGAARARESSRVEPPLADAWELLTRLGSPPLWSAMLHWSCIQAAILGNRPQDLRPHAEALVRAAGTSEVAAMLSAAARSWVAVLSGTIDVALVEAAARGLASVGLRWDGARLAGHAAGRAPVRADMIRLLSFARDLRLEAPANPTKDAPASGGAPSEEHELTSRELEVARLVLEGKTYREIGAALFISPRTAEHHIARIRRRLGATTRSELHAGLRNALERQSPEPHDRRSGENT